MTPSTQRLSVEELLMPRVIEVRSQRYTTDWISEDVHKIDLNKVMGFELHYRGDSWHIVVVTKEKTDPENTHSNYYSYDLNHWVFTQEARRLLNNSDVVILKIVNGWGNKDFNKPLQKLLSI